MPIIVQIEKCLLRLQLKMSGVFFLCDTVYSCYETVIIADPSFLASFFVQGNWAQPVNSNQSMGWGNRCQSLTSVANLVRMSPTPTFVYNIAVTLWTPRHPRT